MQYYDGRVFRIFLIRVLDKREFIVFIKFLPPRKSTCLTMMKHVSSCFVIQLLKFFRCIFLQYVYLFVYPVYTVTNFTWLTVFRLFPLEGVVEHA